MVEKVEPIAYVGEVTRETIQQLTLRQIAEAYDVCKTLVDWAEGDERYMGLRWLHSLVESARRILRDCR